MAYKWFRFFYTFLKMSTKSLEDHYNLKTPFKTQWKSQYFGFCEPPHPVWIMLCFWAMEWQRTSWKDWLEGRTYNSGSAMANLAASRFLPLEQGHRNNSHSTGLCEERMRQWRWDSWLGRVLSSLHWHWAHSNCTFPNLPSNKNLMSAYKVSDCHLPSNLRANLQ